MRRFTAIFIGLLLTIGLVAQDLSYSNTLSKSRTWLDDVTVAADTLTTNQDSIDYIFTLNKQYPVQWYVFLDVDSVDAPTVAFTLSGRILEEDSWTDISTVTYTGSADTTFAFSSMANQIFTAALTGTDTTIVSSNLSILMDTTAIFPGSLNSVINDSTFMLYTGTGTITDTLAHATTFAGTLTQNTISNYYRQLRVRAISSSGDATWDKLILKLWRREF